MMNKTVMKRSLMVDVLAIFTFTALTSIIANSLNGWGLHLGYSISRYVGLEMWSAILFGLGNLLITVMMAKYFWQMGEVLKMGKIYYIVAVMIIVTFVGLSLCPIGRFDDYYGGNPGPVSIIHTLCSRTMFVMMTVMAILIGANARVDRGTRVRSAIYAGFGVFYGVSYMMNSVWIMKGMLVFEAMFILGFMMVCLMIKTKDEKDLLWGSDRGRVVT